MNRIHAPFIRGGGFIASLRGLRWRELRETLKKRIRKVAGAISLLCFLGYDEAQGIVTAYRAISNTDTPWLGKCLDWVLVAHLYRLTNWVCDGLPIDNPCNDVDSYNSNCLPIIALRSISV